MSTFTLEQIAVPLPLAFLGVIGTFVLVLVLWPQSSGQDVSVKAPAWALPGRMVIAVLFILALTSAASLLGPRLSGLLSPLPIFATIFAVFAHKLQGGKPARHVLHGVIVSSFACAVFFLVVAEWIEQWSLVATLSTATFCALLTQGSMLWLLRRDAPPPQTDILMQKLPQSTDLPLERATKH